MRGRELERLLTTLSGYQAGEIDQRVRPLRERELVPGGPRGRGAPHFEPIHAALAVLTMTARRPSDAGRIAVRAMDLQSVGGAGVELEAGTRLVVVIATAIDGYARFPAFLSRAEIWADGFARLVLDGRDVIFTDDPELAARASRDPAVYAATGRTRVGHPLVFTDTLIGEIAAAMADADAPVGYAADRAAVGA